MINIIKVEREHKGLRLYFLSLIIGLCNPKSENSFQNWNNDYSIPQMAHIDKAVYMFGLLYFVFSFWQTQNKTKSNIRV